MKIGPLPIAKGTGNAYVAFGPSGLDIVVEADDARGLSALLRRGGREPLVCELALGAAARAHGLEVAKPDPAALSMKVALAIGLSHGPALANVPPQLSLELVEATIAFDAAAPWLAFGADEEIRVRFGPGGKEVAACVLGQAGEEFGLALYDEAGSIAKVASLVEAGKYEAARNVPCLTVLVDRDPTCAVAAVDELLGVALAPLLLRVTRGNTAKVSEPETARMVAALRAIVALARGESPASGESRDGKRTVVAHAIHEQPEPLLPSARDHVRDQRIVEQVLQFGAQRFGQDVIMRGLDQMLGAHVPSHQLVGPLLAYTIPYDGKPLAALFMATQRLDRNDRAWIERQLETGLSIWEVLHVEPGVGLDVIDLLSGHRCFVTEVKASQSLVPRLLVLGRVLTGATNLFCGMHESPLAPAIGEELVRDAPRSGPPWEVASALVAAWSAALDAAEQKARAPTVVLNTDGHEVTQVEDHFAITPGRFAEVLRALAELDGVFVEVSRPKSARLTFTRAGNRMHAGWENTVVGAARITPTRLVVETNSLQRAEALASLLRTQLRETATWKKRTSEELPVVYGGETVSIDSQRTNDASANDMSRSWLDTHIPALANRTPRSAAADPASRGAVHWLLKDLEYRHGLRPLVGVDPRQLRQELGLDEVGQPLSNLELRRAGGSGRKLVDTILEFARPLLDTAPARQSQRDLEDMLRVARDAWNAAVADQNDPAAGQVASLRAALQHQRATHLLHWTDELVARKHDQFEADRRSVGAVRVHRAGRDFRIEMDTWMNAKLADALEAAGVLPRR